MTTMSSRLPRRGTMQIWLWSEVSSTSTWPTWVQRAADGSLRSVVSSLHWVRPSAGCGGAENGLAQEGRGGPVEGAVLSGRGGGRGGRRTDPRTDLVQVEGRRRFKLDFWAFTVSFSFRRHTQVCAHSSAGRLVLRPPKAYPHM